VEPTLFENVMFASRIRLEEKRNPFSQENVARLFRDRAWAIAGVTKSRFEKSRVGVSSAELFAVISPVLSTEVVQAGDNVASMYALDIFITESESAESYLCAFLPDGATVVFGRFFFVVCVVAILVRRVVMLHLLHPRILELNVSHGQQL
jgi:hypothetical protein